MVIFSLSRRVGAGEACLIGMNAARQANLANHPRHHRGVAIVADSHCDLPPKIDAFDEFQKTVHEMLPRLLAVGGVVDATILLKFQKE